MSLKECNKFASLIWNTYKNKFYLNFNKRLSRVASVKCSNSNGGRHALAYSGFYIVRGNRFTKDGKAIKSVIQMPTGLTKRFRGLRLGPDGALYAAVDEGEIYKITSTAK